MVPRFFRFIWKKSKNSKYFWFINRVPRFFYSFEKTRKNLNILIHKSCSSILQFIWKKLEFQNLNILIHKRCSYSFFHSFDKTRQGYIFWFLKGVPTISHSFEKKLGEFVVVVVVFKLLQNIWNVFTNVFFHCFVLFQAVFLQDVSREGGIRKGETIERYRSHNESYKRVPDC